MGRERHGNLSAAGGAEGEVKLARRASEGCTLPRWRVGLTGWRRALYFCSGLLRPIGESTLSLSARVIMPGWRWPTELCTTSKPTMPTRSIRITHGNITIAGTGPHG